ncbi:SpoIID/LytB domain-containing protein [Virgibacillus kekensis]|uniref:SpoIID/LytB domain-containing protein n=1 Tax=Virgibacillus kekensis TaxID=202261 RepID=A0ABV9DM26_9BACI
MRYLLLFTSLLFFIFPISTTAEEMVTVRLVNKIGNIPKLEFRLEGGYSTFSPMLTVKEGVTYSLKVEKGKLILQGADMKIILNDSLVLIPEKYNTNQRVYINGQPYLGAMEFQVEKEKYIRPVNQLPLDDYLKGVVPFESYPSWPLETLKAQALAARTYAVSHMNQPMNDTIQYQVYGGYQWKESSTKAVEETRGEVITYKGKLIDAFYSASNGGITENNSHVWKEKALPYFPIKRDPYDPTYPWEFSLERVQVELKKIDWNYPNWWQGTVEEDLEIVSVMKRWLARNGYPGDIKVLAVPHFEISEETLESGRSLRGSISVDFLHRLPEGTIMFERVSLENVALDRIRPMIGGTTFKSYLIESFKENGSTYTVKGLGFGHGVGMSQWGAAVMGEQGKSYREIIEFYYPGTSLENIYEE